jgi:hypothetical protein
MKRSSNRTPTTPPTSKNINTIAQETYIMARKKSKIVTKYASMLRRSEMKFVSLIPLVYIR